MPCVRAERATAPQRIGPGRDNMNGYDHSLLFLLFFLSSLAVSNLYPQRFKLAAALLCAPPFHPPATADRGGRVRLGGRDSERAKRTLWRQTASRTPQGGGRNRSVSLFTQQKTTQQGYRLLCFRVCCAAKFFSTTPRWLSSPAQQQLWVLQEG